MNNQIHSQGSQRLSTSVSLYFFYCHFHFIVKPTLVNLLLLFFLNAYLLTFPEVEPPVQDISPQAEFRIFSFSWRNQLLQGVLPHWSCSSLVNCSFQSWIIYFESPHTLWWYFTQPRTTAYPFEICGQAVRKTRSAIMCKECSVWFYQACSYIKNFNFKTLEKHPSYVRSCCNCGLTSFSSSMFSSGIVTSNRFDTLSDFPSSSPWNPTGTQATSTYLFRLGFPLHLSSPSHQKTEQKKRDIMDNIKPISIFIPVRIAKVIYGPWRTFYGP